ncbi:MAG TPA: hypothetical protein VGG75_15985 [Trebonia sp.]|jgi:hypothetical protein
MAEMTNMLTFLGAGVDPMDPMDHCARIESRRDPRDAECGYRVSYSDDPALVPVLLLMSPGGLGAQVWPAADGTYATEPPEGAV